MAAFDAFWQRNPCFRYGLAALLGAFSALEWNYLLILPFILLAMSKQLIQSLLCAAVFLASLVSGSLMYVFPKMPAEGIGGTALIHIDSLQAKQSHFGKQWVYRGKMISFKAPQQTIAQNIDFTLNLPYQKEIRHPPANSDYIIEGRLKMAQNGSYRFSVKKTVPWMAVDGSWSLAEMRFTAKQCIASYIGSSFRSPRSAAFLTGIATGDFDDRLMGYEFSRFGLQHIMAISGFHFSIIASLLSFLLRLIFPPRKTTLVLIGLLTSYFIFLGCGPSILRAWLTILIAIGGSVLEKKGSGLNALGMALLLSMIIDPLMCRNLGFQFSFLTTASILLFYGISDHYMQQIFFKRPLSDAIQMDAWNRHAYCLLAVFRQALSLGLAVNCAALPMTLYHFQKFPFFSLIYNVFFPFLVSISMLLLIIGMLLPFIGQGVHFINDWYTHAILNFTYNLPTKLDIVWYQAIPLKALIPYFSLLLLVGILLQHRLRCRQEAFRDLAYA